MNARRSQPFLSLLLGSLIAIAGCNEGEIQLDERSADRGKGGGGAIPGIKDRSTPEKLAQAVLDTLAANDKAGFERIISPPKAELITFLRTNARGRTRTEQRSLDLATDRLERGYAAEELKIRASFDQTRGTLTRAGFDFSRMTTTKTSYRIRERGGIKTTSYIYVYINDGRRYYRLTIDDTMLVNGNWYSIDDGLRLSVDYTRRKPIRRSPSFRVRE